MTEARAIAEIVRLHDFLADWFRGSLPAVSLGHGLADALHPDFACIMPSGTMVERAALLASIEAAHGSNPAFRIEIREPRLLATWGDGATLLMTYIEAQFGALNSLPADNLRRSSAVFETVDGRLLWRHLQETALPATT